MPEIATAILRETKMFSFVYLLCEFLVVKKFLLAKTRIVRHVVFFSSRPLGEGDPRGETQSELCSEQFLFAVKITPK